MQLGPIGSTILLLAALMLGPVWGVMGAFLYRCGQYGSSPVPNPRGLVARFLPSKPREVKLPDTLPVERA